MAMTMAELAQRFWEGNRRPITLVAEAQRTFRIEDMLEEVRAFESAAQQREFVQRAMRPFDMPRDWLSDADLSTQTKPTPPVKPETPPKPEALDTITFKPLDNDLTEYDAIAADLGFAPADLKKDRAERKRREIIGFLLDNGMPYYETGPVKVFMDGVVAQKNYEACVEKQAKGGRGKLGADVPVLGWKWAPLSSYRHAIPIDILKRAQAIKSAFGKSTVEFAVTDYEVVNPDPFIAVSIDGCAPVVFGVWDEPGFKAIGRDVK